MQNGRFSSHFLRRARQVQHPLRERVVTFLVRGCGGGGGWDIVRWGWQSTSLASQLAVQVLHRRRHEADTRNN